MIKNIFQNKLFPNIAAGGGSSPILAVLRNLSVKRIYFLSWLTWIVLFLVGSIAVAAHFPYATEDVGLQNTLLNADVGDGNFSKLRQNSYIISAPIMLLVHAVAGFNLHSIFLQNFALWLVGITLFYLYLYKTTELTRMSKNLSVYLALFPLAIVAIFPISNSLNNPNHRNVEIGLAMMLTYFAIKYLNEKRMDTKRHFIYFASGTAALALFIFSDPYWAYFWLAPLLFFIFSESIITKRSLRKPLFLAGISLTAFMAVNLLIRVARKYFEFYVVDKNVVFESVGSALAKFDLLAVLYNKLFVTISVNDVFMVSNSPRQILNTLLAALVAVLIIRSLFLEKPLINLDKRLAFYATLYIIFIFFVLTVTTNGTGIGAARYFIFAYFIMGGLFVNIPKKYFKYTILLFIGIAVLNQSYFFTKIVNKPQVHPNQLTYEIIEAISEKGYSKGYGDTRTAGVISYLSSNEVKVVPTICKSKSEFVLFERQYDASYLEQVSEKSFLIVDKTRCNDKNSLERFGEPVDSSILGENFAVYYYNYDLKYCLANEAECLN